MSHPGHDGDASVAATALLTDFRAGRLGKIALEGPPPTRDAPPTTPPPVVVDVPLEAPDPPTQEESDLVDEDFERRLRDGDFAGW